MSDPILSNQDYGGASRILNLPAAIAPGQPLIFEQLGNPYSGGYSGKILPQSANTLFTENVGPITTLGTLSTPAPTSANKRTAANRSNLPTAATAGSIVGVRCSGKGVIWRGNAAGLGGFRFHQKIAGSQFVAGVRMQAGLTDSLAAPTNLDPLLTTTAFSRIALAVNDVGGDYNLIHNLAGAAPTVINLAGYVFDNISVMNLELTALPNASSINYKVWKDGGAIAQGTLSTNIPPPTAFLAPSYWITNNVTAAVCSLDFVGWWLDSTNS